jgi:hypothetical protein
MCRVYTWKECSEDICKQKWSATSGGKTQKEEDDKFRHGNYGLLHCMIPGCHELFWRGYTGWFCSICNKEMCGECMENEEKTKCLSDQVHVCVGECEAKFNEKT